MITLQLKRGAVSTLHGASLLAGELVYATDTKEVYASDGSSLRFIGAPMVGTYVNRPTASHEGRLYLCMGDSYEGNLYYDNGTTWVLMASSNISELSGDLDDISDGTTYGRVLNTELGSNKVKQLSDATSGKTVTADDAYDHITDVTKHRLINDSGSAATDLWSAQKIADAINSAIAGWYWKAPVKGFYGASGGPTPIDVGERWLAAVGSSWEAELGPGTGYIAEWNGSSWDLETASEGVTVYVDSEDKSYTFKVDGVTYDWAVTSGPIQVTITAGNGLSGGGTGSSLSLAVNTGNGIEIVSDNVCVDIATLGGLIFDTGALKVYVDDVTLGINGSGKLYVKALDCGVVS